MRGLGPPFILALACALLASCEPPEPTADLDIYIAGIVGLESSSLPCYWLNGKRTGLPIGTAGQSGSASFIHVFENDVYIAGRYQFGFTSIPCYWKNGVRTDLSVPTQSRYPWGKTETIFFIGSDMYISGFAQSLDHSVYPCFWKNGIRHDFYLDGADFYTNHWWNSIYLTGNDIYFPGAYAVEQSSATRDHFFPCYWKNGTTTAERIDLQPNYPEGEAHYAFVSGSDVYIAGIVNLHLWDSPCYWKNGVRTDLSVIAEKGGTVSTVSVFNDNIYLGGGSRIGFFIINGWHITKHIPCFWKNGVRTDLSVLQADKGGLLSSLFVVGNSVYAAGASTTEVVSYNESYYHPCYWNNDLRIDLEVPADMKSGMANSIFIAQKRN